MTLAEIKISSRYRGLTKTKTFPLSIPGSWAEVPPRLRLPSIRILCRYAGEEAQLQLFHLWSGLKKKTLLRLSNEQTVSFTSLTAWAGLEPNAAPLISKFEHRGIWYHFPKEKFQNGMALEYPIADDFYNEYCETDDRKHLVALVATICRKESLDPKAQIIRGDVREELKSRSHAEFLAESMTDLPIEILMTAKMYFEGVKLFVHKTYGHWLFPKVSEEEEEEEKPGLNFGWWGAYQNAAEAGVFGNLEEVYQTHFHTVCVWMIRKKEALERMNQSINSEQEDNNGE